MTVDQQVRTVASQPWEKALAPILSLVGVGISSYLLWVRWSGNTALCTGFGGCDLVSASPYAQVGSIPVAMLGLVGYVVILGLSLWQGRGGPWLVSLFLFGGALVGVFYSLYLTYLELFVILAVCPWCVASALVMIAILGLSWRGLEL